MPEWIYSPARDHTFSEDRCFLCGATLDSANRSNEHIFPRWLLEEFDLWDQKLTLVNQTPIPYRQLTIPCCQGCNGHILKPIEDEVLAAYRNGPDAIRSLERRTLFLWLGKIFYGLIFREMFLPYDRSDVSQGPILEAEAVAHFTMHHLFLQAARGLVTWSGFPASIAVFNCQESRNRRLNFDFGDNVPSLSIGLRMGRTGVFARLQDFGALSDFLTLKKFEEAARLDLHPVQFREVLANGIYAGTLFNRTPKFVIVQVDQHLEVIVLPLAGFSGAPLFDEWDRESFARVLAKIVGVDFGDVYDNGAIRTWLVNPDGEPNFMPIDV